MEQLVPASRIIEIDGHTYVFKRKLIGMFFSYRCQNFNDLKCPFSIPFLSTQQIMMMRCISSIQLENNKLTLKGIHQLAKRNNKLQGLISKFH